MQPDDDPLVRSLEYSLATASARRGNSDQRQKLEHAALGSKTGPFADLRKKLNTRRFKPFYTELINQVRANYSIVYDPTIDVTAPSSDGISRRGAMCMVDTSSSGVERPIKSEAEFRDFMKARAPSSQA